MSSIITIHISRIVHAITLLATMLILMPLAKMIPMTALAAILIIVSFVSYNMSEWRAFKALLRSPMTAVIVLLITFSCTVIFDLVVAISIGMIMAMFLFVNAILEKAEGKIRVYQVNGPLFLE